MQMAGCYVKKESFCVFGLKLNPFRVVKRGVIIAVFAFKSFLNTNDVANKKMYGVRFK